ncbi:alpha/beta hydrolase fold domain-containing protein [Facklamia lactis]|uniref:alpha/beta hydrolase fold domain-containing protein n=1 Tax=Facklamia lactis TaxID=2749967 RepID=UPI0018CC7E60|nr:alpha/beta hydrolase [Facklamia lactis]MBG9981126.1 alpha/beta hydrolase [Facklamia lactis]
MIKIKTSNFTINLSENTTAQFKYFYAENSHTQNTIIYLHGGGLIFGNYSDLPEIYIDKIVKSGSSILSCEYLLAPEYKLPEIYSFINKILNWYISTGYRLLQKSSPEFFLFGRSSGAYLALLSTKLIDIKYIKGIISFYGYYSLQDAAFMYPSQSVQKHPLISQSIVTSILDNNDPNNRYLIYLFARQKGQWLNMILDDISLIQEYSLNEKELKALPPLFLTHSLRDSDVPVRQSKKMHKLAPQSVFYEIDSDDHDFDRTNPEEGTKIYSAFIQWLNELI